MSSPFGTHPSFLRSCFVPHDGQKEVVREMRANFKNNAPEDQAAMIEVIASRGWGKTLFVCCEILVPFLESSPDAKVMWVAPNYQIAMTPIEDVFKGVNDMTGERWVPEFDDQGKRRWEFVTSKLGPVLTWHTGATVTFKSGDAPESIVSRGYNLIIIDEAALIEERVLTQQILGTARRQGIKIFMITSPRGKRHWTYKYFLKGQDKKEKQYLSFQQPYTKNPHFSPVLAKLIKDLPDWIYRQEYLAEFIEDGDGVFRGLDKIMVGPEISFEGQNQEWSSGDIKDMVIPQLDGTEIKRRAKERRFVVALDLAKSIDFTVFYVMDIDSGECVYFKRFNKTDYREVMRMAVEICKTYNDAELIFDATGVGSGFADFLNNYDVVAHPYVFTNESKSDLINRLALSIEHAELKIPNISSIRTEMGAFTYSLTRTGKISYNAPSGFHDDIVIAIALANWFRKENLGAGDVNVIEEILKFNNRGAKPGSFWDFMDNDND